MNWTRRSFLGRGMAGVFAAMAAPRAADAQASRPPVTARGAVVLCSRGERWGRPVNAPAWQILAVGGDGLDAVIAGANVVELDPEDQSVGYGGLPNEEGVVQLDASVMSGRLRKSGAVAALERIKTPSSVARRVLERTDHVMLVGEGALRFARAHGFEEANLLTEASRLRWLKWKENLSPDDDWLPPADGVYRDKDGRPTGTINVLAVDAKGDVSGTTTTSGLAWKIPGRAGDSPIIGAGEYTDNEIGAAGSTGRGESNMMVCGGFLTVEHMRRGMKPTDACLETLKRVMALTPPQLIQPDGRPKFQLTFYAVNKKGDAGAASLFPGNYATYDGTGAVLRDTAHLYE